MTPPALSPRARALAPRGTSYATLPKTPKVAESVWSSRAATGAHARTDGRPVRSLVLAVGSALAPTRVIVAASLDRARAEGAELVVVVAGPVGESDLVEWTEDGARCVLAGRDASLADLRRIGARHARGDVITMLESSARARTDEEMPRRVAGGDTPGGTPAPGDADLRLQSR